MPAAPPVRLRALREASGLSQAQLAERAGVSRALVSAVERGLHRPAVDTALRLASAVGTTVEELFAPRPDAASRTIDGRTIPDGTLVRLALVGDERVAAPVADPSGWAMADAVIADGRPRLLAGGQATGTVVAGCDPALVVAAGLGPRNGATRLVEVSATSGAARAALRAGRVHAAAVHGPAGGLGRAPAGVRRFQLARWSVGVALTAAAASVEELLTAATTLVRRPEGAASQQALDRASSALGLPLPEGPVARDHATAALLTATTGTAAITYEPAALALGLSFLPVERHVVELWVAEAHAAEPGIAALLDTVRSRAFRERVGARPGYDLAGCGDEIAA